MSKRKKLKLDDLKVKSFITKIDYQKVKEVKGGTQYVCFTNHGAPPCPSVHDTGNCCDVVSINCSNDDDDRKVGPLNPATP